MPTPPAAPDTRQATEVPEDTDSARLPLVYPFATPAPGEWLAVAPGVHWIRMPLPLKLDHINLWALEDGEGWSLVDTGMGGADTLATWERLFTQAPMQGPLQRVLATHMHPDHIGVAGWLTRRFDCRLWMTQLEYLHCRVLCADSQRAAPPEALRFYHQAGWNAEAIAAYQARFGFFGRHIEPLPDAYRRLHDGEEFDIGGHRWRVLVGTGHSPEHACFYCPSKGLLIAGDQVLPRISSNVSVHPTEPDADPMSGWLASLARIRREVPDGVLVLPSHNGCFRGLHQRLDQLLHGQLRTLERLRRALHSPKRVVDLFVTLFGRAIGQDQGGLLGLATGESLACLNHLWHRGELLRWLDDQGVAHYQLRPALR